MKQKKILAAATTLLLTLSLTTFVAAQTYGPPTIGEGPPQDLNNNGYYKDVYGDGELIKDNESEYSDPNVLGDHLRESEVQNYRWA